MGICLINGDYCFRQFNDLLRSMAILKLIMLEHYYKLIDSSFKNANEYNPFDVAPQVWIEHTYQGVWSR